MQVKWPHTGGQINHRTTKPMEVKADSLTWLTVCELMWLVSVFPAAETKTSFPDCGATAHVEDALGAEERPVVIKGFREAYHNITNVSERLSTAA